jgi:hypothetical protein
VTWFEVCERFMMLINLDDVFIIATLAEQRWALTLPHSSRGTGDQSITDHIAYE